MQAIVVGQAEVNAKNNLTLTQLAAADLEKNIQARFSEYSVTSLTASQNDRAYSLVAAVQGKEQKPVKVKKEKPVKVKKERKKRTLKIKKEKEDEGGNE